MKQSVLKFFILFFLSVFNELVAHDQEQAAIWEQKIIDSSVWDNDKTVKELSLGLKNMGYRQNQHVHFPEVEVTYKNLQQKLLSIPGHARYIAEEYEGYRNNDKAENGVLRYWYIGERLAHLPSPETVAVLGEYLDDFKDTKTPNLPIEEQKIMNRSSGYDIVYIADLPWMATYSLSILGLREPPLGSDKIDIYAGTSYAFTPKPTEQWKKTRAWYKEVKAGKRTFSFRGQSVEYRFKPDGTWDTIPLQNPPDDAIVYPIATKEQLAKLYAKPVYVPPPTPAIPKKPEENRWGWIVGVIVILFAISFWIGAKKRKQA